MERASSLFHTYVFILTTVQNYMKNTKYLHNTLLRIFGQNCPYHFIFTCTVSFPHEEQRFVC